MCSRACALVWAVLLLASTRLYSFQQEGLASWYGGKFQGRRTASGEVFDTAKLTAAHQSLPFGTLVKVINLENGKTTVVRINDRGPFVSGRIIDLSRAAAAAIGMTGKGVTRVRIEVLPPDSVEGAQGTALAAIYSIQVGAFRTLDNAERLVGELRARGFPGVVEETSSGVYRVLIKNVRQEELEETKRRLREQGWQDLLARLER
jgi:rare lipoprotein A